MNGAGSEEHRLVARADDAVSAQGDTAEALHSLEAWRDGLEQAMRDFRPRRPPGLGLDHPLAQEIGGIDGLLTASVDAWAEAWAALRPASDLAAAFERRLVLLVFGKFNAGKSALCNFLADRFRAHGREVRYFHLEDGRVVETAQPFVEGATETTSRLQGVCLGDAIVLLDTPGLHSTTPENAALTRRFIESADALLWLSGSASPGQVQELEELARELHRHKPLLPVITRSDFYEEDEVDGEIVKRLRDKTPANRAMQEDDVRQRAASQLRKMAVPSSVLMPAVSISARVARERGQSGEALRESGFDRLYAALLELLEPAIAYKRRKPVEVLLHHLEETVLGAVEGDILPALADQAGHLERQREELQTLQSHLVRVVWREVAAEIAGALRRCESAGGAAAAGRELASLLREVLARELAAHLVGYELAPPGSGGDLEIVPGSAGGFDYAQLHDELQRAIHRQVSTRLDDVFRRISDVLSDLERDNVALRAELVRQAGSMRRMPVRR